MARSGSSGDGYSYANDDDDDDDDDDEVEMTEEAPPEPRAFEYHFIDGLLRTFVADQMQGGGVDGALVARFRLAGPVTEQLVKLVSDDVWPFTDLRRVLVSRVPVDGAMRAELARRLVARVASAHGMGTEALAAALHSVSELVRQLDGATLQDALRPYPHVAPYFDLAGSSQRVLPPGAIGDAAAAGAWQGRAALHIAAGAIEELDRRFRGVLHGVVGPLPEYLQAYAHSAAVPTSLLTTKGAYADMTDRMSSFFMHCEHDMSIRLARGRGAAVQPYEDELCRYARAMHALACHVYIGTDDMWWEVVRQKLGRMEEVLVDVARRAYEEVCARAADGFYDAEPWSTFLLSMHAALPEAFEAALPARAEPPARAPVFIDNNVKGRSR